MNLIKSNKYTLFIFVILLFSIVIILYSSEFVYDIHDSMNYDREEFNLIL